MNKIIVAIIIVVVVVVIIVLGGYFFFNSVYQSTETTEIVNSEENKETKQEFILEQTNPQPLLEQAPIVNENIITYTDIGYSPNTITIKNGETVVFKNRSSKSMWPASAMHPTHRLYAGTSLDEHCPDKTSSAFDACTGILPGGSWSFKFDKIGSWGYHDHLSPKNFGKIIVK